MDNAEWTIFRAAEARGVGGMRDGGRGNEQFLLVFW